MHFSKLNTTMKMSTFIFRALLLFCLFPAALIAQDNGINGNSKPNRTFFPDEYSVLDDDPAPPPPNDEMMIRSLDNSRKHYLRALGFIDRGDTSLAAKYFNRALSILNRLASYPGIEQNDDFTELAQSIVDDYETYIRDLDEMENSSLFFVRDKLFSEIDTYLNQSGPEIETINVPRDSLRKVIAGLPVMERELTIPMDTNEAVRKSLAFLTKNKIGIKFTKKCLARSSKWFPMILRIAEEEGAPFELAYLAMTESGLNPNAVSSAKAVGLWQFMRSTGKLYGLNSSSSLWLDERRDPVKATRAAMRHLVDLYNDFGDWHLALAAYNCGPGCVKRAIRRTRKDNPDYWEVRKKLPRETAHYVPLYIAAVMVAMNPEAYGFDLDEIKFEDEFLYETVQLNESVNLKALAKCVEMEEEELKLLNPELIRSFTPPDRIPYELRIPVGKREMFDVTFAALTPEEKRPWIFHEVKRRETLYRLSKKYGVSRKEIAALNGLRSYRSRLKTGTILKIPVPYSEMQGDNTATLSSTEQKGEYITHTVRRGESLYRIAQKYGVRLTDLRNLNDISYNDDNLRVGEKLIIAKNPAASSTASTQTKTPQIKKIERPKVVKHKVRRGETLGQIADDYGVTIASIKNLNRIRGSKIITGQILKVETTKERISSSGYAANPKKEKIVHKVRRGETIGTIAARYGVRESEIKKWNSGKIRGNTIFANSYLSIYPNGTVKGSSSTSKTVNRPPKYYRVRKGDNLIKIARKFGVSVSSLKRKNKNLNERRLQIGQRIRIQ